jgi:hypothetical protein
VLSNFQKIFIGFISRRVLCDSASTFFSNGSSRPFRVQFRNHFSQTVGLLGRVISPSQSRYLNTVQHKRMHTPNIHSLSGIRTNDPSVRAREDSSRLRPRGYCDRHLQHYAYFKQRMESATTSINWFPGHLQHVILTENAYRQY